MAERSTAVLSATFATRLICSSDRPVVQTTTGIPVLSHQLSIVSAALAIEKSIITSALTVHSSSDVNTGKDVSLLSAISMPATMEISSSFSASPAITLPMAPLQPCIIALTILCTSAFPLKKSVIYQFFSKSFFILRFHLHQRFAERAYFLAHHIHCLFNRNRIHFTKQSID